MPEMKSLRWIAGLLAVVGGAAAAAGETPQYGGTLTVGTEYSSISSTSWDPADWHWKTNNDALYLDHLLIGDQSKSVKRGGPFHFTSGLWMPDGVQTGDLAETWRLVDEPLSVVFELRKGVMWPDKPNVMKARELVADDVVFSFNRARDSSKALKGYFDFIKRVETSGSHTVTFFFKEYNTEWARRIGNGLYDGILPREIGSVGQLTPKNATGTGPFLIEQHVDGSVTSYMRNPNYWGKLKVGDRDYQLPFADRLVYPALKDTATAQAALRTGKLDILRAIPWQSVAQLKAANPQLLWEKELEANGTYIALRMDVKPLDNILVRKALNLAINRQEIVDSYFGGNAEIFNYPMHRDWLGYYRPLSEMPADVRELFAYDPVKAKALLVEAGLPNGFALDVQVNGTSSTHLDLLSMVAGYLSKIGVRLNVKPMEYASYLAVLKNGKHSAGYMMSSGHISPIGTLLRSFGDIYWNASKFRDPRIDERMRAALYLRDEAQQIIEGREITDEVLRTAPFILLPTPYRYQAWWPWVKNYEGEMYLGAVRASPLYARSWIDQKLKKSMGF